MPQKMWVRMDSLHTKAHQDKDELSCTRHFHTAEASLEPENRPSTLKTAIFATLLDPQARFDGVPANTLPCATNLAPANAAS